MKRDQTAVSRQYCTQSTGGGWRRDGILGEVGTCLLRVSGEPGIGGPGPCSLEWTKAS